MASLPHVSRFTHRAPRFHCNSSLRSLRCAAMLAFVISNLFDVGFWLANPWFALTQLFSLWMFIDAIRREEWIWAVFIFFSFGLSAVLYFFFVYRSGATVSVTQGFELPGAHDRRRI